MTAKSPAATSIQSALIARILVAARGTAERCSRIRRHAANPSPTPHATKQTPASPTFEQALDELDALVRRMEAGELSLDESIAAYRRGAELARLCQARLAQAEQEIKQLEGDMLKPLDPNDLRGTDS